MEKAEGEETYSAFIQAEYVHNHYIGLSCMQAFLTKKKKKVRANICEEPDT